MLSQDSFQINSFDEVIQQGQRPYLQAPQRRVGIGRQSTNGCCRLFLASSRATRSSRGTTHDWTSLLVKVSCDARHDRRVSQAGFASRSVRSSAKKKFALDVQKGQLT